MCVAKVNSSPANGIADAVNELSIKSAPRAKSKNLNVIEEFEKLKTKRAASFVVIGQQLKRGQ